MTRATCTVTVEAAVMGSTRTPSVDTARERVGDLGDSLAPRVAAAREAAEAAVDTARQLAADRLVPGMRQAGETVRDTVVPAVSAAAGTAYEASRPVGREARRRGGAALTALLGEPVRPARRWPSAALFLLLGAGLGMLAGTLVRRPRPDTPVWLPPTANPGSSDRPGLLEDVATIDGEAPADDGGSRPAG